MKTGVALEDGNALEGVASDSWIPLGMSSSGAFAGELAFVGYGIEAPPVGYRELEGIDLHGKVALVLRYEPQERDEGSPFDGRRPSRWSSMRYKILQARERGAAAVVFVTGPLQDDDDRLPALRNDGPESPAGIPVLQVRRGRRGRLAARRRHRPAAVPGGRGPRPAAALARGRGSAPLRPRRPAAHVRAGRERGRDPARPRGAGQARPWSWARTTTTSATAGWDRCDPNERAIHNGADDNASGTVAVLLAAERVRAALAGVASHRAVVFALFAGEEVGLAGSSRFVASLPASAARTVAMINLDMVGRLRDDQLLALGTESAPQWNAAARRGGRGAATQGHGPRGRVRPFRSDQLLRGRDPRAPLLHGQPRAVPHARTTTRPPSTRRAPPASRSSRPRLASRVARGDANPVYARTSAPPAREGDSRGYGAYLGTVPDYRAMEQETGGVLLADMRAGGPADRAGVRKGDRIVEMAGTRIENLYDMTFALQDHRPGETIEVVVIRDGERVSLRATLGERAARAEPAPAASPSSPPAAAPAPAADPHAGAAAPPTGGSPPPSFYAGRPGRDFVIGAGKPFAARADEPHLADIRQLTFGGENAEAYFSPDGRQLVFQATTEKGGCDQQYVLDLGHRRRAPRLVGQGAHDLRLFRLAGGATASSTPRRRRRATRVRRRPDRSQGYVWASTDAYDLWEVPAEGGHAPAAHRRSRLRRGSDVVPSRRQARVHLHPRRRPRPLRDGRGGPGAAADEHSRLRRRRVLQRGLLEDRLAREPSGRAALEEYRRAARPGLVRPSEMELFVMNADGSEQRQVTRNGAANFCPYFHPDGKRILYSSNARRPSARVRPLARRQGRHGCRSGSRPPPASTAFPSSARTALLVVWASNRADPESHQTNLFVARWVE